MDNDTMEHLIEAVKSGDLEKFGVVIEALQQPIFTYCYHMLGHKQEAEDAVQEVLLKVYEKIDKYTKSVSFSAWVYKIAYHHCINLIKRKKLSRIITFLRTGTQTVSENEGEANVDSKHLSEPLHRALANLSPEERSLVILRVLEERGYEELSLLFNKKPATLRKQYERAIKKCKIYLVTQKGGNVDETFSAIR
ncbi:RNA polymerase sigma factor [Brevibacillus sp. SYSU BS000544]|uniref:RNA polymerase sigma factor n=1 Tax=Brevibacillus sp. SYSU BS000544 TaxID=3416443 RepID=UPI003CE4E56E